MVWEITSKDKNKHGTFSIGRNLDDRVQLAAGLLNCSFIVLPTAPEEWQLSLIQLTQLLNAMYERICIIFRTEANQDNHSEPSFSYYKTFLSWDPTIVTSQILNASSCNDYRMYFFIW